MTKTPHEIVREALQRARVWDVEGAAYYRDALALLETHAVVPRELTQELANAAVDGSVPWERKSPQQVFRDGHKALIAAATKGDE